MDEFRHVELREYLTRYILKFTMRIRIVKPVVGVLDGVSLGHLKLGFMYDLHESLARYLISSGAAEETLFDKPALVKPIDDPYLAHLTGGVTVVQIDIDPAADNRPRTRKRR